MKPQNNLLAGEKRNMAKFKTPVFIKPTNPTGDVIVFGKSPEQEIDDSENGIARFGGMWRAPSYVLAYMKAAAVLIDHGVRERSLDEIALPAFYMQRHALELFVKRLLSWIYEIAKFRIELGEDNQGIPSSKKIERFRRSHNIPELVKDLHAVSHHFGFGEPPAEISSLVNQVTAFEVSETWSRYENSVGRDRTVLHHVSDEIVLPIVEIQRKLESVHCCVAHRIEGDPTYENTLYEEWLHAARATGSAG